MATVKALTSFDHHGSRRNGEVFEISDAGARELANAKLVKIVESAAAPKPQNKMAPDSGGSQDGAARPRNK